LVLVSHRRLEDIVEKCAGEALKVAVCKELVSRVCRAWAISAPQQFPSVNPISAGSELQNLNEINWLRIAHSDGQTISRF